MAGPRESKPAPRARGSAPREQPTFFATPADFRAWLEANHTSAQELWVGFHKKGTGRPSITWPESVDQALCFGWIDGVRRSVDADSYMIRFTPRRAGSNWSAVNIRRARELAEQTLMTAAGLRAFEARDEERTNRYSYEREQASLSEEYEREFRQSERAWEFFQAQPPGYRKLAAVWIMTARQEATQRRRLARLIASSAAGERFSELLGGPRRPDTP